MAIKWKSTDKKLKESGKSQKKPRNFNPFLGLISWIFMLAIIIFIVCVAASLLMVALDSTYANMAEKIYESITVSDEMPYEYSIRIACVAVLFIVSLFFIIAFRNDRKEFEKALVKLQSKVWVEIKLIFIIIPALLVIEKAFFNNITYLFALFSFIITVVYLISIDVGYNKKLFKPNIIDSILRGINKRDADSHYEKISSRRLTSSIVVIVGIVFLEIAIMSIILYMIRESIIQNSGTGILIIFLVSAFGLAGIVGTVLWYSSASKRDIKDINEILLQIEKMYNGNLHAINTLPPSSTFFDSAMQLNMIRTGIEKSVEEAVKADKTKVELITNVSHDIKTPLTSIVTYVDLLKREKNLPEHVYDYINVISSKAERLSAIVQDVFEVSKAATGNISLEIEQIDLSKLLQQTLSEMDYTIQNSGLIWRIDIPPAPAIVNSDGQRMYRVFQNLIKNCVQYSLEGTRVYVTLINDNKNVTVTIRNTSKAEFSSDSAGELTNRFVRGDKNRTTEGSGLGLSIAKTFTEACGGKFSVKTDSDIFIVTVEFPATKQLNLHKRNNLILDKEAILLEDIDKITKKQSKMDNPQRSNDWQRVYPPVKEPPGEKSEPV